MFLRTKESLETELKVILLVKITPKMISGHLYPKQAVRKFSPFKMCGLTSLLEFT